MSTYDLLIRNGTLVTHAEVQQADIAIAAGCIVALQPGITGHATREIDAQGLHIFPGVIDAHVHFNEPGRTDWEGFATGTRALAAGGTTAFFDMPLNASPPTLDADSFTRKRQAAEASALVDFALWGGLVPENIASLDELAACGIVGFKAFMSQSGIDDFPSVNDDILFTGMSHAARLHKLVAVHAEDDQLTSALARQAQAEQRTGIRDYLASRPISAELDAIKRAIHISELTACALHIVHVSCGAGVVLVAEARARGVDVTCETCPHYLALTEEDVERLGAIAKCAPPVRDAHEQAQLWEQLREGNIQFIASDHSPSPFSMKTATNFFQVWGGISSCQSLLQLLLSEGHAAREVPLPLLALLTSTAVARRFHISQKGQLVVGKDADLTLVNLRTRTTLQAKDLQYRHAHSPYIDRSMQGQIVHTIVRGTTVYQDGHYNEHAHGRLFTPDM